MEKVLRSRINEAFDLDTRVALAMVADSMNDTSELKKEAITRVFRDHNVQGITDLNVGPGTNRCAFRLGEYILKVATDFDGCIDNLKEFQMCRRLMPFVTVTHEVSENGVLLIAEYARVFQSPHEFSVYEREIRQILSILSEDYLIGDVGIDDRNYTNWGLRRGTNTPVCLDYAYVYNASSDVMKCSDCGAPLFPSDNYNYLVCKNPDCKGSRVHSFTKIRERIGRTFHAHHIDHLDREAYRMDAPTKSILLDPFRSQYLEKEKKKKKGGSKGSEEENSMESNVVNVIKVEGLFRRANEQPPEEEKKVQEPAPEPEPVKEEVKEEEVKEPESDDTLAFSEDVETPPMTDLFEDEDLMDSLDDPNLEGYEVPEEMYEIDEVEMEFNPNFFNVNENHIFESVSKISNLIAKEFQMDEGYEMVAPYLPGDMDKEEFYHAIQNATFRSLTKFLKFKVIENRDENGVVRNKRFEQPDLNEVMDDERPTLIFLQTFWENNYGRVNDDTGIQIDWLNPFRERIIEKLPLSDKGIDVIVDWMQDNWVAAEEAHSLEHDTPSNMVNINVTLLHYQDHDELRIYNEDVMAPTSLSFYIDVNGVDPGIVKEPNNEFEWLRHFTPAVYAKSKDRTQFSKDGEFLNGSILKAIEYGSDGEYWLGGTYKIDQVIEVDVDERGGVISEPRSLAKDTNLIQKVNALVDGTLKNTDLSAAQLNFNRAKGLPNPVNSPVSFWVNENGPDEEEEDHVCSCGHHHEEEQEPVQSSSGGQIVTPITKTKIR